MDYRYRLPQPTDFGYTAETWTNAKLTAHINETVESSGHTCLYNSKDMMDEID